MTGPILGACKLFALLVASGEETDLAFELAGLVELVDELDGQVSFAAAHF